MNQNENQWDKLLKIKTTGRDDSRADQYRYPYEPTPYCVLERLANSGLISKKNVVLDYGTGKGRVCFFLSYQTRCSSIGVEYDDRIFAGARANQEQAVSGKRTSFELTSAEEYPVPTSIDRCYFFNPFSIEILLFSFCPEGSSYQVALISLFIFIWKNVGSHIQKTRFVQALLSLKRGRQAACP